VIAATNRRLEDCIASGQFRTDLYYRLSVFPLYLQPLKDRGNDIILLADHFVVKYAKQQGKPVKRISTPVIEAFLSHQWPGNVRELENILERAFVLCKTGMIEPHHLPESIYAHPSAAGVGQPLEILSMKDMEAIFLTNALRRNGWNRLKTARQLGMHKSTLFRKIKSLNIAIPTDRKSSGRGRKTATKSLS